MKFDTSVFYHQRFFIALRTGGVLGLFLHVIFYILFNYLEVDLLANFNLFFSIPAFLVALFVINKKSNIAALSLICFEVILHQIIATIALGWASGFILYILFLVSVPFFYENIPIRVKAAIFWSGILILAFLVFYPQGKALYQLSPTVLSVFFFTNAAGVFIVNAYTIQHLLKLTYAYEKGMEEINALLSTKNREISHQNEALLHQTEEISHQRTLIEKSNQELLRKNKQINLSIRTANNIQQAILPDDYQMKTLLKNYFIINKPKDVVSGDFYWIERVDEKIILVTADCTGHGVPGAFMSLIGSNLLNKIILVDKIINPEDILSRLHQEVRLLLKQKETGREEGMDVSIICLEKIPQGLVRIVFAGAKHSLFYISKHCQELGELKGTRKSVGGTQNEKKQFCNQEIILESESLIYLGSDGYIDQNDQQRKSLGSTRFKKILESYCHLPLEEQKTTLLDILRRRMRNTTQRDDILLMGIKI